MQISEVRWALPHPAHAHWAQWGEANFLFDAHSGQTHFLNYTAREILFALLDGERTTRDIYSTLCLAHGIDDDADLEEAIVRVLNMLDSLGVIIRAR